MQTQAAAPRGGSSGLALVTGASSGIGLELARVLAREGYALALVARRSEPMHALARELEEAHGTPSRVFAADLGSPAGVGALLDALGAAELQVDVLVNNAGYGLAGHFHTLPADEQLGMLDLNVRALTQLTRALLPGMVARGRGRVLNVASTAAFQPGPYMAVYYASKAYVLSFSLALHEEVRGSGVSVTALCPGFTDTGFAARAATHQRPRLFDAPLGRLDARQVAEAGWQAMRRGKPLVVPGLVHRVGTWVAPFTPRALLVRLAGHLNAQEGGPR